MRFIYLFMLLPVMANGQLAPDGGRIDVTYYGLDPLSNRKPLFTQKNLEPEVKV